MLNKIQRSPSHPCSLATFFCSLETVQLPVSCFVFPQSRLYMKKDICIYPFFLKNLFIFDCIGSLLLRMGFFQLRRAEATLHCGAWASHCGGFSSCGARAPGRQASVAVACGLSSCGLQALERRLSSCGTRAQLPRGMWDLPGPGLEPASPEPAGGFLTIAPRGKSLPFL